MSEHARPAPPRPGVFSIAGPSIAVFMFSTLAGVVLIRIVADLGVEAVAAVTAGQRINFIVVALLMGMGAATTALVSRAWGAGEPARAAATTRLALKLGMILCVALSLGAALLAVPVSQFFGLEGESARLAVIYIRWLALFSPAQAIVMVLATACRAVGDARTPMYLGIGANTLSIIAAWALAYGELGLPAMGLTGAAIGWGTAFMFSAVSYLLLWSSDRLRLPWKPGELREPPKLRRFTQVAMPATLEQIIMQAAMLVFIGFVAVYGSAAFTAYGIGLNIFSVAMVIGLGFSIAASALVGQCLGAGDVDAALESTGKALRPALITMVVAGVVIGLSAQTIAAALVGDAQVVALTADFLLALAVLQPMLAIDFVLSGAMRGAGDTRFPMIAGLLAILGCRLPLAALIVSMDAPVIWLYWLFALDEAVKLALILWRYRSRRWLKALD